MCHEKAITLIISSTSAIAFATSSYRHYLGSLIHKLKISLGKMFKETDELVKIGVRTRIRQIKVAYIQSYIFKHNIRNM